MSPRWICAGFGQMEWEESDQNWGRTHSDAVHREFFISSSLKRRQPTGREISSGIKIEAGQEIARKESSATCYLFFFTTAFLRTLKSTWYAIILRISETDNQILFLLLEFSFLETIISDIKVLGLTFLSGRKSEPLNFSILSFDFNCFPMQNNLKTECKMLKTNLFMRSTISPNFKLQN